MNRKILLSISLIILLFSSGLWYYYFTTINNNTWIWKTVSELIIKNYNKEFHHLDLRTKKLETLPNICEMVKWTNYEYDIWSLDLADNVITKINTDLSCLKNLQELNLSFNKIKEIENLNWLIFIKKLDLGNNEISKIDNLDKLTTLIDLHLWYNKITSTNWLEKLTNLTSLKLQHNEIADLSSLKDLSKLEELKLEFNKLTDENLKDISALKNLKIITLWENTWIKKETIDKFNEFSLKNMQEEINK